MQKRAESKSEAKRSAGKIRREPCEASETKCISACAVWLLPWSQCGFRVRDFQKGLPWSRRFYIPDFYVKIFRLGVLAGFVVLMAGPST